MWEFGIILVINLVIPQTAPASPCEWPDCTFPQPACPNCSLVICGGSLTAQDCPPDYILVPNSLLSCCPACVKYLQYSEPCPGPGPTDKVIYYHGEEGEPEHYPANFLAETVELPCSSITVSGMEMQERVKEVRWEGDIPLVVTASCAPGLECRQLDYTGGSILSPVDGSKTDPYPVCNAITVKDPNTGEPSIPPHTECQETDCICRRMDYRLWEISGDCSRHQWKPSCSETGMYSPMQVRTSTSSHLSPLYRWCSDPMGGRIFGEAMRSEKNMYCACSRKVWELEQDKPGTWERGRKDVSLHCDSKGSYESLQCDRGNCWCVEPESGRAISSVVPEDVVQLLPCIYGRDNDILEKEFGNQYLRKCDKRSVTVARNQEILRAHGITWSPGSNYKCDPDGSFAPVFRGREVTVCKDNMGQNIGAYQSPHELDSIVNCRCARDDINDMPGKRLCQGNGNYRNYYKSSDGDLEWCAEETSGWRVSNTVRPRSQNPCCLESPLPNIGQWSTSSNFEYGCRVNTNGEDVVHSCHDCKEELMKCP